MSTLYGIHKQGKIIELIDDDLPVEMHENEDLIEDEFIEVAAKGIWGIHWKNEVAPFLSDDIRVYPLDNTAQGIYTIGDIKKEILKQEI